MNVQDPLAAVLPRLDELEREAIRETEENAARLARSQAKLRRIQGAKENIQGLVGPDASSSIGEEIEMSLAGDLDMSLSGPTNTSLLAPDGPKGSEAVAAALKQSPAPLTLSELTAAVAALGWRPATSMPERAVRAAANRLRNKDPDFDFVAKRYAFMSRHRDQLPPTIGGIGGIREDDP